MRSRYPAGSRSLWLLAVGIVLLAAGYAASPASAQGYIIIPLQVDGLTLVEPNELNPQGMWVVGRWTTTDGVVNAFLWDILGLARDGDAPLYPLPGDNGNALSVSADGEIGGQIGDEAAWWYFPTPSTVWTFTYGNIDGIITSVVRYTDADRFLLHAYDKASGGLAASAIGQLNPQTSTLNLVTPPEDSTTVAAFWDFAGDSVVGATYSKVSDARFPYRARIVNGTVTAQPTALPTGFTQGASGGLFFTDENGNAFGDWRAVGGTYEAGVVLNDGTSAAFGSPTPFDYAYAVGTVGDLLVARAGNNDDSPEQSFVRNLAPGSGWMPLSDLVPTDSGWTSMDVTSVNSLGFVGTGTLNGVTTGFVVLAAAVGATTDATLTQSADIVRPGTNVQITFNFPNDAANPRQAAKITLSDPVAAAFAAAPADSTLLDNGKTLLIPLTDGQTQVVVSLNTAAVIDRDRDVRLTASTSSLADPFIPATFAANYVTVDKP
jgi:hypothetical protein